MRAAAKKPPLITSLEDERYNVEVIQGIRMMSPRPAPGHVSASAKLGALLILPFELGHGGPGGWWILTEPELHLETRRMAGLAYGKLAPDRLLQAATGLGV
jgi:hypothetical protein